MLIARDQFFEGEKLCLRSRGPRRLTEAISNYIFQVEVMRNGRTEEAGLKFYSNSSLEEKVIM